MQDMTKGSILSHLIHFAIPMVLGNLLQLTYNAVDSIIISKFLGETALAAVSTSDPIFTILVLGASGISLGASVMISKFRGAKDEEKIKQEFATTLIFGLFFSLGVFALGLVLAGQLLRWIQTPALKRKPIFGSALWAFSSPSSIMCWLPPCGGWGTPKPRCIS